MKISKSEYTYRLDALQAKIKNSEIDALIVSEEEDIYYLTGLTYKSLERLFLLVITATEATFILPKMELAHLSKVDNIDELKYYWEYPAPASERWKDILLQTLKKGQSVGMGDKSPYEIAEFLSSESITTQKCNYVEELRWVKSKTEIELIKRASGYCDFAIEKLNGDAYFGMTELEVFSIGRTIQQKLIKETEFDYLSSNVLVAAWPGRISHQPHGSPRVADVLEDGSHISLAFLRVNGYAAELERTFFTRQPNSEEKKMFECMLEARRRSYQVLRAGVHAEEVDFASKHFLEKAGFKDNLMHRTGHGIGLGNHEGPFLAAGDQTILEENMVVSIEPGIYIEGLGGFRHSDTVRVTKDGYEVLTNCADDISSMTFTQARSLQKLKGRLIKKMFNIKS